MHCIMGMRCNILTLDHTVNQEMHLCKRNRCIRLKISEYHLDLWTWLNSVQMRTPTGSSWTSNNYITRCHRRLESVRGSQLEVWVAVRASVRQRAWALSDPRLSNPARMRKKCCYGQKNLRSISSSLSPSLTHLSHTTNINPFATLSRSFRE